MFPTADVVRLVVALIIVILAAYFPQLKDTLDQLGPLVIALVLALLGIPAAVQILAMKYGYEQRDGRWMKVRG